MSTKNIFSSQSSEDEVLLRNILYDGVIMMEFSFLNPQLPGNHLKNIAVRWLFVADHAIQSARYVKMMIIMEICKNCIFEYLV